MPAQCTGHHCGAALSADSTAVIPGLRVLQNPQPSFRGCAQRRTHSRHSGAVRSAEPTAVIPGMRAAQNPTAVIPGLRAAQNPESSFLVSIGEKLQYARPNAVLIQLNVSCDKPNAA